MKKTFSLLLLLLSGIIYSQSFITLDGVKIPTSVKYKEDNLNTKLVLNGAGIRDKMWISMYIQALYLIKESNDPVKILNAKENMAFRLYVTSSLITKKRLTEALEEGLKKSFTGDLNTIKDKMDTFMSFFDSKIKENDVFDFVYNAKDDTTFIFWNGKVTGKIKGFDFKRAFFGIWLEEKSIDNTLKKRLLGE
ncbi:MAG TPA: chalcone isomerase family protein [Flavobacterium sp.]|jgi:hypothetical protein